MAADDPVVPVESAVAGTKTAVVIGGTGKVGKQLIRELVESPEFVKVTAVVRKKRDADYFGLKDASKLEQKEVDMFNLDQSMFEGHEYGFSAFGTTRKQAGSAVEFERIDYGINVAAAEQMKKAGVKHMQLVSSQGTNEKSWLLYPSVKGRIEEKLKALEFERLTIWRPGLLAGRDDSGRTGESILNTIVPNCFRIHVRTVAKAMVFNAAKPRHTGAATYEHSDIKEYVGSVGGKTALVDGKL